MFQIQWFPGHMLKTQKSIQALLPTIDLVIQILDARAPHSTRNPLLAKMVGTKPSLYLMNKQDLANPQNLGEWIHNLSLEPNTQAIPLSLESNASRGRSAKLVKFTIHQMMNKAITKKGKIRVIVTGIPNVGKSSLINTLTGKKSASVAKKAGLTQSLQTYQFPTFSLIDTPGILWHKWDERTGYVLAILGSVTDRILDFFSISKYAFQLLSTKNKGFERSVLGQTASGDFYEFISLFAQKRGFLQKGGEADIETACFLFVKEIREGKWGPLILESPDDFASNTES